MDNRRSTSYVIQKIGDLVECSICIGMLTKPKTLYPCMHTFCLACLETYAKGKQRADQLPCPLCRVSTTVPSNGLRSLPANHLMENVLELHRISQPERRQTACDNCSIGSLSGSSVMGEGGGAGGGGFRVDMYCVECRLKLCTRCVEAHKRLKITSNHKVVNLGPELSHSRSDDTLRRQFIGCSQHPSKSASQFCQTCSQWTCHSCTQTGTQHRNHEMEDIPHRMKKLRKEIRMDISATTKLLAELQRRMEGHVHERNGFVANVRQIEEQINCRAEEAIASVRTQKERLLKQLEASKMERLRDMNCQHQEMAMSACMLDTFKTFSAEVSKRGDADIFYLADEIRNQVQELLHAKQRQLEQVEVRFNNSANNAGGISIGDLALVPKKKEAFDDYLTSPVLIDTISGLQNVSGVAALDYKLYIVCNQSQDLHIYHTEPGLKAHCRVILPSSDPQDIAACPKNRCMYVCDYTSSIVAQLNLKGKMTNHWKTKENPGGLSVTEQGNVLVTFPTYRLVREFSPEGVTVRSFSLPKDLDKPWHCVRLRASARLVVCSWHRVGILEENGAVAQVHGGTQGSQLTQFYCPSHLAADDNEVILVADTQNNRLKLVRASMECRELNTDPQVMKGPRRLLLDLTTRLLYVAVSNGNVLVYRIMA